MTGCVYLGVIELSGGNCAQWTSGIISAAAVCVALGGYFWSEHVRRRELARSRRATLISIKVLIERAYQNLMANDDLTREESHATLNWFGEKIKILPSLTGVRYNSHAGLSQDQHALMIDYGQAELAGELDLLLRSVAENNAILVDYERRKNSLTERMNAVFRRKALDHFSDEERVNFGSQLRSMQSETEGIRSNIGQLKQRLRSAYKKFACFPARSKSSDDRRVLIIETELANTAAAARDG